MVLGLTSRVANRVCGSDGLRCGRKIFRPYIGGGVGADGSGCEQVCGVAGCDRGEKYFGCTLGCALGGRAIKYGVHVGDRLTMRQPSAQGL